VWWLLAGFPPPPSLLSGLGTSFLSLAVSFLLRMRRGVTFLFPLKAQGSYWCAGICTNYKPMERHNLLSLFFSPPKRIETSVFFSDLQPYVRVCRHLQQYSGSISRHHAGFFSSRIDLPCPRSGARGGQGSRFLLERPSLSHSFSPRVKLQLPCSPWYMREFFTSASVGLFSYRPPPFSMHGWHFVLSSLTDPFLLGAWAAAAPSAAFLGFRARLPAALVLTRFSPPERVPPRLLDFLPVMARRQFLTAARKDLLFPKLLPGFSFGKRRVSPFTAQMSIRIGPFPVSCQPSFENFWSRVPLLLVQVFPRPFYLNWQ